jgi:hypothetical protein
VLCVVVGLPLLALGAVVSVLFNSISIGAVAPGDKLITLELPV